MQTQLRKLLRAAERLAVTLGKIIKTTGDARVVYDGKLKLG